MTRRLSMLWSLVSAFAIHSTACGGSAGSQITTDQLRPLRTLQSTDAPATDSSLQTRMEAIAAQLEEAGLTRGSIWQQGFVPSGSRETLRLEIPGDTCATIVALASSGVRDVDAVLYLPDGTQVAQDAQPDSHPTVQVCADGVARYFYYTLHAYEGAGAYLVASFLSDRSLFARAAAIIGGRPGVATEAELAPEERAVQAFGESVQRRGYTALKTPARVMLARAQSVRVALDVDVARCYSVGVFALDGVEDVNVRVLDEDGRDVAFDASGSRDAATQFCADREAAFSVEVTSARGQGAVVVATYSASEADAGGNNGLWLGSRAREQLSTVALPDALREDAVLAVEAGFGTPTVKARGVLSMGQAVEHEVALKAGQCTRIAAVGGVGTGVMALSAQAPTVATVSRVDASRLELCAAGGGSARVVVISRRGDGDYAVSVATKAVTER